MKLFTEKDFKLQNDYITCSVYEAANIANKKVAPLLEQCMNMREALEKSKCDEIINQNGSGMFNKHDPYCKKCETLQEFNKYLETIGDV